MRNNIKDLRLARGVTQEQLARELGISRGQLSKIEDKTKGLSPPALARCCEVLECTPEELDYLNARPSGGQRLADQNLRTLFRADPIREPTPAWTSGVRIASMKVELPTFMRRFEGKLEAWQDFLDRVPSEIRNETILHLVELNRGVGTTDVSTNYIGFTRWPVIDQQGRPAGHLLRPALVTREWILIFQVTIRTPKVFRMDGLGLVLKPKRLFFNLEVDGSWHDGSKDRKRAGLIDLPTVRIPSDELMRGPSLTARLRAAGLLPPNP